MYLIDTNVISELRKARKANQGVVDFFRTNLSANLYLSVQTIGEIRRGIENVRGRGDAAQAKCLESWLDMIVVDYADRILNFDSECAQLWGRLMSPDASNPVDKQIAAIAIMHGLEVVTRNVQDFSSTGVDMLNPFA